MGTDVSLVIPPASDYQLDEPFDRFAARHIGPNDTERKEMLAVLGASSVDAFIKDAVPESIRSTSPLDLPTSKTEQEVLSALRIIAAKNQIFKSFIGMGYYDTHTPTVILRNLLENPAWYTAYTPYQPEIAQGRLEALLNFQTMVIGLTGMDIANASLLDEGSAAAEAMAFCHRVRDRSSNTFFVSKHCHPQSIDVIRTRAEPMAIEVVIGDDEDTRALDCFGALFQYPASTGEIVDYEELIRSLKARGVIVAIAADLLALTLIMPPGELGADVVIGSSQRFGVPLWFGGPHAAYFATRDKYKRSMPGRLVGVSIDAHGDKAYRLAIQTREQHIRREKATSNICTAQALLAIVAAMYAVYHGPKGVRAIAQRVHDLAGGLARRLASLGYAVPRHFFDTVTVDVGARAMDVVRRACERKVNFRRVCESRLGISVDETTTAQDIETIVEIFSEYGSKASPTVVKRVEDAIPAHLRRTSSFLTQAVFNSHHSETQMLRYLRGLADKDLALDRTMIPLGSCTMKLNGTTEMIPVTWREFAGMHPFAPIEQSKGYQELFDELEQMLCKCTGYDAVSLQPNAGSQGEYAGLLAIRAYHQSRGETGRDICLIPISAHGTNPASAQMAGMEVVPIACDADGNVDLADLRLKCEQHKRNLAAMMITYPSTHGVFEEGVRDVCDVVHGCGGQVYIDGANLNALVGLCSLSSIGGDVSHINLHKTFCIPHGGGGPGAGPVCVKSHLAPFLPGRRMRGREGQAVSSAPWGSAGILPITWAYISLMGARGLLEATLVAILNANYVAKVLSQHYQILYKGKRGRVAHECIIDLREIQRTTGVTAEDVAKRLIDYGFHAPTMSFPVPGTLMIEPTESESKSELDRFCNALISIRQEIRSVEQGIYSAKDSPLRHAPHVAADLVGDWQRAYSRAEAVFPVRNAAQNKYWPPVGRVDNAYGDLNLICACT